MQENLIFANPHRRIDGWIRENPGRVDFITGLLYTLLCMPTALGLASSMSTPASFAAVLTLSILQSAPLMLRRRYPWPVTLVVAAGHLMQLAFDGLILFSQVSVPILVYTMAVYGKRWQSFSTLGLGLLGALLATFSMFEASRNSPDPTAVFTFDMMISFVGLALVVTLSWTFGDLARTRRLAMKSLREHADRLEKERLIERALAASDERNHIAREMHDIVAHSLSVIITQANGARYAAAKDPEIAIETLKTVSDTGRASLKEMRRLLGVLRKDEELENRPLPSLANIPELVESVAVSGLNVQLETSGTPRKELPAGAELTIYRCIQESLTNVIKHAGPDTQTKVHIEWNSRGLNLTVSDDGRGAGSIVLEGTGHGLQGMKERVALYEGTCTALPQAGGGFAVNVYIPYTED
ncbi:sensor histidine kinase [Glutamicibacter nicotianae]|uniref:sensor histidine kinase n=1 Tax=Glutamicibacter nicotianae TaxID=37929 RepID=UPI001959E2F2|nr:sensor histidine kinase [Glutamicibacter nicotianae]MBM7768270.1 signal transduction histidine kinase [Glutamicibacter nicotianae]